MLRDAPVYSSSEGFRFLVPSGWTQSASAVLPPGKLDGENFLVRYQMLTLQQGATLQILCMADSPSLDLQKHHAGPSFRVEHWDVSKPAETIDINGVEATHMQFAGTMDKAKMTKDVTCFRRNGRVYSFAGVYLATDQNASEQIRRAVSSVIWEQ